MSTHDCRRCVHHRVREDSAELHWLRWHECDARGGMSNLRSFPFQHTRCEAFTARTKQPERATLPLFHTLRTEIIDDDRSTATRDADSV